MPTNSVFAATLTALVAQGSTASGEATKSPTLAELQKCIAGEAAQSGFSGVVSVARQDGTVSIGQGKMAGATSAALSPTAQFNLGSVSKMFTAVAVAQLIDAKKVSLEDPIGRYVSDLTPEAAKVTVKQLLTHSGGLGNFFTPDNLPLIQKARSLSELKPLVAGASPAFSPGLRFEYSNSGFLLLGLLVEKVSGQTFANYLQKHIFAPAGMTRSSLMPGASSIRALGMTVMPEMPPPAPPGMPGPRDVPNTPPPGRQSGQMEPELPPPGPLRPAIEAALPGTPAGGSYSTAADMQRFFAALLASKLTSDAMRDMLTAPQIVALPAKGDLPERSYGMGFGMGAHGQHRWFGHNGGTLGANVETMTFPESRITVVIMANRDPPVASSLLRKVLPILFDGAPCRP
jgi:D-alanyl-D-alanine carboxypeptidase